MKPYSYEGYFGLAPTTFFWIMIGFSVIMFAVFIYDETKHKEHWTRRSWIRIISSVTLWCIAFGVFVSVDVGKDRAFEASQMQLKEQIEKTGLTVTGGTPDPTPGTISQANVSVPDKDGKDVEEDCSIYSPNDINKEINVVCGTNPAGMSPENIVKWYKDGSPTDEEKIKEYTFTPEKGKEISESVTVEQEEAPAGGPAGVPAGS